MKKAVLTIMIIALIIFSSACAGGRNEIGREPIDCRYTEPYSEVVTDYEYKYSILHGEFKYVPNTHSITHPGKYEILYLIKYDNNTALKQWEEVDRSTYEAYKGGLKK